jgi:chorismate lyase / 3-hydroxybenzoate synthase
VATALTVDYVRLNDVRRHPASWWQDVLAVVSFDGGVHPMAAAGVSLTDVNAPVLGGIDAADATADGDHDTAEVWRLAGPMHSGQRGRVCYRHNGRLLFASLSLAEAEFADTATAGGATALRRATEAGYREMFGALETLAFPYPLRIWNFFSDINLAAEDGERYWHFNGARQEVFIDLKRSIAGNVPAASAVGVAPCSPLTVYCIASAQAPIALENPRQCSAWDYPAQYGPRSPTFARACISADAAQTLFISGTASIVGHASAHAGDQREQTRETVRNIHALIGAANARLDGQRYRLEHLHYKVYVRQAEHQPSIDHELRQQVGAAARVLYLKADICRPDLLLEIEAVGTPEPL